MDVLTASSSTATLTLSTKHKPLTHPTMNSHRFPLSPSSPSFRSSPLNPHPSHSSFESTSTSQKRRSFPASRPLRPFSSIAQSLPNTKPLRPTDTEARQWEEASQSKHAEAPASKHSQKPLELSSKWTGGFIVLGMTQAEFSRQD